MRGDNNVTLCIPTAFVSWTGEALDTKIPLLRSIEALSEQAMRILKIFGTDQGVSRVYTTVGPEQEYFLIDRDLYFRRPDLLICERTLFGARPPKGQQLEDHYFGTIPPRVLAFMAEAEQELYRLGVPVKTRHNEVAPGQYEIAPLFEPSHIASDHQMVHHGDPEARGSALWAPGAAPREAVRGGERVRQAQQLVHVHGLRGQPARSAGRDPHQHAVPGVPLRHDSRGGHPRRPAARLDRVGGQRSSARRQRGAAGHHLVFLGEMLSDILEQVEKGVPKRTIRGGTLDLGAKTLPQLPRHSGDRNRTSPFAFTGNKFEFRAVGSSASIAWPNTVLNTIVAESLDHVATELERPSAPSPRRRGSRPECIAVLKKIIKQHKRVIFDGDNYSEEWHAEAERRGLPNLQGLGEAFPVLKARRTWISSRSTACSVSRVRVADSHRASRST